MFLKSGNEPLKSWNSEYAKSDCTLGHSFLSCSVPRISTLTYVKARIIWELGPIPLLDECRVQCPQAIWTWPSLWCISAKALFANRKNCNFVSPKGKRSMVFHLPAMRQTIIAIEPGRAHGEEQRTGARNTFFIPNLVSGLKQGILLYRALLSCSAMTGLYHFTYASASLVNYM